jgi:hypothetical protein
LAAIFARLAIGNYTLAILYLTVIDVLDITILTMLTEQIIRKRRGSSKSSSHNKTKSAETGTTVSIENKLQVE